MKPHVKCYFTQTSQNCVLVLKSKTEKNVYKLLADGLLKTVGLANLTKFQGLSFNFLNLVTSTLETF